MQISRLPCTLLPALLVTLGCLTSAAETANTLTAREKAAGWRLLWDGRSPAGWRSMRSPEFPSQRWAIHDGVLSVHPNAQGESDPGEDLITNEKYSDFELKVDFQLTPGANSGIKYFVRSNLDPVSGRMLRPDLTPAIGCEYQILDDERHPDAKAGRDGNRKLGSLYDIIPAPAKKSVKPMGQWNTARILVKGNHVEHWLNGKKLLAYDRNSPAFHDLVARSKFKKVPGFGDWPEGHLLLQDHGGEVLFRNIKIRTFGKN